jgi:hypothetical protein
MTMKVSLTETGGWANIKMGCTVDTASLPTTVARALKHALADSCLFREPEHNPRARDARIVVIEVVDRGRHKIASFSEASPPQGAGPVLEILRPYCKPIGSPRHK